MRRLWKKYQAFKPFSDEEAWFLFRIAAIAEACGWTLLISGLIIQKYLVPQSNIPVLVTGQIHGSIFMIYFVTVIILAPSMRWRPWLVSVALASGIPPYGSLFFEIWAANARKLHRYRTHESLVAYRSLVNQKTASSH